MRPFIIIEGPDGSGKTVLAHEIEEKLGYSYGHTPAPTYEANSYLNDKLNRYPEGGAVFDRFHIGSFVYGNVFRHLDDLTSYDHWQIEGRLMMFNTLLVFAFSPTHVEEIVARKNSDSDAKLYENPVKQAEVVTAYAYYVENLTSLPFIGYDFASEDSVENMVRDIESIEEHWENSPMPVTDGGSTGFGNQYSPKFCFVGSTPHPMLFKALRSVGIPLNHICIIDKLSDSFSPSEFWLSTELISLGYGASGKLSKLGLPHRVVPHPVEVYEKNYKDVNAYGEALIGEKSWPFSSPTSKIIITKNMPTYV